MFILLPADAIVSGKVRDSTFLEHKSPVFQEPSSHHTIAICDRTSTKLGALSMTAACRLRRNSKTLLTGCYGCLLYTWEASKLLGDT